MLTLRDHWYSSRVPPRLSLPALDAHRPETDDGDRAVAIAKLYPRPDFRSRSFDAHCRVDPLFSRQREVEWRPGRRRILACVRRIRCVALRVRVASKDFGHPRRPPRPLRPSATRLARTRPACTSRSAARQREPDRTPIAAHLSLFAVAVQAVDLHRRRIWETVISRDSSR